jgi:hypothetical protein
VIVGVALNAINEGKRAIRFVPINEAAVYTFPSPVGVQFCGAVRESEVLVTIGSGFRLPGLSART